MKILHVHPTFESVKGGVERHLKGLSKYLAKRGHQVEILSTEKGGNLTFEGGRVVVTRGNKYFSLLSTVDYDIVHIHGYRVPWANLFGLLRKIKGNRVVMTTHGIYPYRSAKDAFKKKIYDHTLGRANIRFFDALIALTPETKDALIELGAPPEKIWIIPNSIDVERFEKLPTPEVFFKHYQIAQDTKIILYVGRLDWNKGLELALTSFSSISEDLPKTIMVILGKDFGFSSSLRDLSNRLGLKDRVLFLGEVSEETLISAYGAAEVLLLPSIYEGLPTVVLEAMACGIPVIAFRTGGTAYTLENGKTGVLVDYKDCKGMAEKLLLILSDESFKNRLGKNAKELVQQRYSWAKNAENIERLYKYVYNPKYS